MKGNPLFIIDDEADAASLNTLVNRNRQSSINKYLDSIKNGASSSLYLQVTGNTAGNLFANACIWLASIFLQIIFSLGMLMDLGGDFFLSFKWKAGLCIILEKLKTPMREVVVRHLLVCQHKFYCQAEKYLIVLFHPSVRVAVHKKIEGDIQKELNWCIEILIQSIKNELGRQYADMNPSKSQKCYFRMI